MHPKAPILSTLLLTLITACAPALQISSPAPNDQVKASLAAEQPERHWWRVRFKLAWPDGTQPEFSRHLLIAEQLYMPAIATHEEKLLLWRFHRRAGRDDAGNQFSLIYFTDEETAAALHEQVSGHPLTEWLLDRGMIEQVRFNLQTEEEMGRLEQSSDPNWPMEIQRSWPYFIMGASQSWLVLIRELSGQLPLEDTVTYDGLLDHYREVDVKLTAQWREYGQHAYLHHLSAVFGYEPIRIRESELKRF